MDREVEKTLDRGSQEYEVTGAAAPQGSSGACPALFQIVRLDEEAALIDKLGNRGKAWESRRVGVVISLLVQVLLAAVGQRVVSFQADPSLAQEELSQAQADLLAELAVGSLEGSPTGETVSRKAPEEGFQEDLRAAFQPEEADEQVAEEAADKFDFHPRWSLGGGRISFGSVARLERGRAQSALF